MIIVSMKHDVGIGKATLDLELCLQISPVLVLLLLFENREYLQSLLVGSRKSSFSLYWRENREDIILWAVRSFWQANLI